MQKCRSVSLKSMVQRMAFLLSLHSPLPLEHGIPTPKAFPQPVRQGLDGEAVQFLGFSGSFSVVLAASAVVSSVDAGAVQAHGAPPRANSKRANELRETNHEDLCGVWDEVDKVIILRRS